ncbi:hypothetical protein ASPWEDRAFT_48044 [Aspergillus wentii DTO 134E9]|uniref:Aminotransferase class I/classII large domain-containing protein n=1 Tax=Aspergillus wentii DTO 134E9 TaxID=1073089 RepID=A0A1L9S2T0_ASPWE|nr:uncharacterized protein ASPWEDRAFT_48044 [Aspergillus wentii DTO 134E9]KAI9929819.1 hypothetical protein MW887_011624 [Aspergillus wentii]OJJ41471.1 hypothetical protein ASPWEDRAFT_48044 [Aspergillus wentii DTO 134E9]
MASDTISLRARRATEAGSKNLMWDVQNNLWDAETNPTGYVNVGMAENSLMHDVLLEYINTKIELPAKYLTYNDGGHGSSRLKTAMSKFLSRHLHPAVPIESRHLTITNGVSAAIEHLSWALADPGEGILLGKPFYGTFIPDLSLRLGAEVVQVDFDDCDPFCSGAVRKYEDALLGFERRTGKKVRALMLCHPHNPLGRCYPRETIIELMAFCQKYQIRLISDEIYALSVWENTIDTSPAPVEFTSALSIDTTGTIDPQLLHVLWGMSKDFGANGIRVGVIISQANPDLHASLVGVSLYSFISGLSDHVAANILEDEQFTNRYIELNRRKLSDSYRFVAQYVQHHHIEYAPGCNAAFFLWVNLGKRYLELHPERSSGDVSEEVMQRLLQKRVFLASGVLFGSEKPGWFRIVFSQPREYLQEALSRVISALSEP